MNIKLSSDRDVMLGVKKKLRGKIGIYKITSPSGKTYIGQSKDLGYRLWCHFAVPDKKQRYLYFSLKKYGFENHRYDIIELLDSYDRDELNRLEQKHINEGWSTGTCKLNLMSGGGIGAKLSDASRKRISQKRIGMKFSESHLKSMSKSRMGWKATDAQKEKMRKIMTGKKMSEDAIKKSVAGRRLSQNWTLINDIRDNYNTLKLSYRDLGKHYGQHHSFILNVINNKTFHDPLYQVPKIKHGIRNERSRNPHFKLSDEDIYNIKKELQMGIAPKCISIKYGININYVSSIKLGYTRADVKI